LGPEGWQRCPLSKPVGNNSCGLHPMPVLLGWYFSCLDKKKRLTWTCGPVFGIWRVPGRMWYLWP
jgi:hypothetical protein